MKGESTCSSARPQRQLPELDEESAVGGETAHAKKCCIHCPKWKGTNEGKRPSSSFLYLKLVIVLVSCKLDSQVIH